MWNPAVCPCLWHPHSSSTKRKRKPQIHIQNAKEICVSTSYLWKGTSKIWTLRSPHTETRNHSVELSSLRDVARIFHPQHLEAPENECAAYIFLKTLAQSDIFRYLQRPNQTNFRFLRRPNQTTFDISEDPIRKKSRKERKELTCSACSVMKSWYKKSPGMPVWAAVRKTHGDTLAYRFQLQKENTQSTGVYEIRDLCWNEQRKTHEEQASMQTGMKQIWWAHICG